jgi:hypothetical protein
MLASSRDNPLIQESASWVEQHTVGFQSRKLAFIFLKPAVSCFLCLALVGAICRTLLHAGERISAERQQYSEQAAKTYAG